LPNEVRGGEIAVLIAVAAHLVGVRSGRGAIGGDHLDLRPRCGQMETRRVADECVALVVS
jgi:hypothetical protein